MLLQHYKLAIMIRLKDNKSLIGNAGMNTNVSSRIAAFDHVRGLAAIFMIISHIILVFGNDEALKSPVGRFINDCLGTAPAAPVFMMLMGVFFAFPRERKSFKMMGRGIRIYLLGIVLNMIRFIIPLTLAILIFPDITRDTLRNGLNMSVSQAYMELSLSLDILQFAGLAFILLAIIQKYVHNTYLWALIGVIVVFVSPYLWGTGQNCGFFYNFVQPLWGNALSPIIPHDTAFPVFPWLIYPITGVIIGKSMAEGRDANWLFRRMLPVGVVLLLGGGVYVAYSSAEALGDYYRMYPGGTSMVLGFAIVWVCLFMWFSRLGILQNVLNKLVFWSENITLTYCVSWVLLCLSIFVFGFRSINNPWIAVALISVYVILTYVVCRLLMSTGWFMRGFRWFLD